MKTVILKFSKTLVALAGNPFGKRTYIDQVKGKLDLSDTAVIIFPDNIEKVASSFVQGFFDEWLNTIGLDKIKSKVTIQSIHPVVLCVQALLASGAFRLVPLHGGGVGGLKRALFSPPPGAHRGVSTASALIQDAHVPRSIQSIGILPPLRKHFCPAPRANHRLLLIFNHRVTSAKLISPASIPCS